MSWSQAQPVQRGGGGGGGRRNPRPPARLPDPPHPAPQGQPAAASGPGLGRRVPPPAEGDASGPCATRLGMAALAGS